jgi:hypothetical protein
LCRQRDARQPGEAETNNARNKKDPAENHGHARSTNETSARLRSAA